MKPFTIVGIVLNVIGFLLALIGIIAATVQSNTINTTVSTTTVTVYKSPERWTWYLIIIGALIMMLGLLMILYEYFYDK